MSAAWFSAATALMIAVIGLAAWAARRAWHVLKRTMQFLDDFYGEPAREGVPARPGVMARLQGLTADLGGISTQVCLNTDELGRIRSQVFPNGGTSLRDAVDSVAAGLTAHREITGPAISQLTRDVTEMRDRQEQLETQRARREDPV